VVPAVRSDTLADLVTDGSRVFVSNFSRNRIEVLPVTGTTFTDSIAGASAPWGLAVGNNGDTLYVANNGGTNISVISIPTLSQVRLLRIPDVHLYSITYDVKTDSVSEVVDFEYSDHPQFIAQIASGQLLYSTSPTPTRSDGTVRIFDPGKDLTYEFGRASEIFTGYATDKIGQGVVVNALDAALSGSSRLFVCPRRLHSNQTDPAASRSPPPPPPTR
jgi:DNA-binding beta-propeller fold protein YncE